MGSPFGLCRNLLRALHPGSSEYNTTPHHTASHHTTPHHTTPHHTTPHHITPHHTTPHHTTSPQRTQRSVEQQRICICCRWDWSKGGKRDSPNLISNTIFYGSRHSSTSLLSSCSCWMPLRSIRFVFSFSFPFSFSFLFLFSFLFIFLFFFLTRCPDREL